MMAKDYFKEITPRSGPMHEPAVADDYEDEVEVPIHKVESRGIRNISHSRTSRSRVGDGMREAPHTHPHGRSGRRVTAWWIWVAAGLSVVVLGGIGLLMMRSTTVTVIPKSHPVVFGPTSSFTAYPNASSGSSLSYTAQTSDLEDSEPVASQGTMYVAPKKASGEITVVNNYSSATVKLIKNTRFSTPDGLIFKTPATVVVPGKKGSVPGSITITVIAEKEGTKYNVGPVAHFTLPGLQTTPAMYTGVYARSNEPMAGGTAGGNEPAIAPATLTAAIATVRGRLEARARAELQSTDAVVIFPDLIHLSYRDMPNTTEAGGGVRIHETAHVEVPAFPKDALARAVAQMVSADTAESASINLVGGKDFAAHYSQSTTTQLGDRPVQFLLSGQALLIWSVDSAALSHALAGRDKTAFQGIVSGFPGIQEARTRVASFWRNTFPSNPSDIKVIIEAPSTTP
jgi:hypothetical protein